MLKIAFDLDNCLIKYKLNQDTPNYEVIDFLRFLNCHTNAEIFCWSGGGIDYTQRWTEKLGLDLLGVKVMEKGSIEVDIAIDDEEVKLGKVNIQII